VCQRQLGDKAMTALAATNGVDPRLRKRFSHRQGRPQKAVLVQESLYRWFLRIRRSVQSRNLPRFFLGKALALMEEWVHQCVARGLPAAAGSVSHVWLSR
jgi:hypothetical protein